MRRPRTPTRPRALVEAAASPEPNRVRGSRTGARSRRRVSFENRKDGEHFSSAKSAFERGVVVFGRPRQLMELRKRLGHREDVACVFEPAKPSEVLQARRRLTETIATFSLEKARASARRGEARAETGLGAASRIADRGSSISNLESRPRVGVSSENLDSTHDGRTLCAA